MAKKKCVKGWGCGNSCISRTRKCRSNLDDSGKKVVESFMQYINRTQEPGEVTGPSVPTIALAKQDNLDKFNKIAREIIGPPPIKELTSEEESLVTGEVMQAARGYNDMLVKAGRIRETNPDITQAEAEALAQYIHHTYYSDMNRVLYMNNLEQQEDGTYNVSGAVDAYGKLIAPKLSKEVKGKIIPPDQFTIDQAKSSAKNLDLVKKELEGMDSSTSEYLSTKLMIEVMEEHITAAKSAEEHEKDYKDLVNEMEDSAPEDIPTFEEFVIERGGRFSKESRYTEEGVETMKAVNKAFKNALHKLDKATPESIAERYAEGNRWSGEFSEWDGKYRRFVDFDSPEALEGFLKQYTENEGENIIHPAATSTTWRNTHAHFDKKDSLQITVIPKKEGTEGVLVDRFKNLADEAEVLYPPGQKFKVVSIGQTNPETPTLSKSLDALGLEEFSKDLAFNIFDMDASELEGNKFLSEFKKELEFSVDDPMDINWIAPDMLKIMSKAGELEPPTMEDMKNSPEWAKVLPPDYVFTKMIQGEFEIPEALMKKERREIVLQEV